MALLTAVPGQVAGPRTPAPSANRVTWSEATPRRRPPRDDEAGDRDGSITWVRGSILGAVDERTSAHLRACFSVKRAVSFRNEAGRRLQGNRSDRAGMRIDWDG